MTLTGKCDICRLRKVKCDEKNPMCSACLKGGRACKYSYGRPSAFIVEDPMQFSGHGKAKVAPLVYPMVRGLVLTEATENAGHSHQISTHEPKILSSNSHTSWPSTWTSVSDNSWNLRQLSSPETRLTARFIHLLGPRFQHPNPFVIGGLWAEVVPSRIGSSDALDLAVEFAIDSFSFSRNATFSTRKVVMNSRSKALNALRLELQEMPRLELIIAIRMHFYSEVLMDFVNWASYYFHMKGLFELLESGSSTLSKDQDYWVVLYDTYIEEVTTATFVGKISRFDNDFFLTTTQFSLGSQSPLTIQSVSRCVMHCWIQIPRLICLVREARSSLEFSALESAISLAESLWALGQAIVTSDFFATTAKTVPLPAGPDIHDIIPRTLHFDSIHSLVLLTRHWMFEVYLCGLIYMLRTCFPSETDTSRLPTVNKVIQVESSAATHVAQSLSYSLSVCPFVPLVPLRILIPLQTSVGSWHRAMIHSNNSSLSLTEAYDTAEQSCRSRRMIEWILRESNRIHSKWGFPPVALWQLEKAQEFISGGVEWHNLFPINSL